MCTVSIVPIVGGLVLTSSRDEQKARPTLAPQYYEQGARRLWYPKDQQAGGTWLALEEGTGKAACLLNGAFEAHVREASYRKSRGQLLLEYFDFEGPWHFQEQVDLSHIEPFTLLMLNFHANKLAELRWDGTHKHYSEVDTTRPRIWSSATLYTALEREARERWFDEWLEKNDWERIIEFHLGKSGEDPAFDIRMLRPGGLQTVSISQVCFRGVDVKLFYQDLL